MEIEQKPNALCKTCNQEKPRQFSHISKNGTFIYINPESKNQWMSKTKCAECSLEHRKVHYKNKVRPKLIETKVIKNKNKSKYKDGQ